MNSIFQKMEKVLKGFLIFILFYCSYLFQYIPVYLFHLNVSSLSGNVRMAGLLSTFSNLVLLFILLIAYRKDLMRDFSIYWQNWRKNFDIGFSSWATGLIIMMVSNAILIYVFHAEGANNENAVRLLVKALPVVMGFDICCVAPVVEEIVFRKTLKDVFHNRFFFVGCSFLLFGLAHVATSAKNLVDWLYIVPYGVMGGVFAYADSRTDTLFTSILFHAIHNTLIFIITLTL